MGSTTVRLLGGFGTSAFTVHVTLRVTVCGWAAGIVLLATFDSADSTAVEVYAFTPKNHVPEVRFYTLWTVVLAFGTWMICVSVVALGP